MKKFLLAIMVLGVTACDGQSSSVVGNELQQKCSELDAQTEGTYNLIKGYVEKAGVTKMIIMEGCMSAGCKPVPSTSNFSATMLSMEVWQDGKFISYDPNRNQENKNLIGRILINSTPPEPTELWQGRPLYFEENKEYVFCGKLNQGSLDSFGDTSYLLNNTNINLIEEIK